jgi:hypothetical protein
VNTAYEASPECRDRGCVIYYERKHDDLFTGVFQHGDNPEAVLLVPLLLPSVPEPSSVIRAMFREWAERVHRHQDGLA